MPAIQNYKQFDPQWHMMIGRGTMTMAQGGCGICSIADVVGNNPKEVGTWMESMGYIYPNEGTVHEGVVPTLNHFGVGGSMITPGYLNGQMSSAYFNKTYQHVSSGKCAILLMGGLQTNAGGKCRNSYWTNAGHYICACGARPNGDLLIHDPASYARDGWHSITDTAGRLGDSLNGDIKKIWFTDQPWTEGSVFMVSVTQVKLGTRNGSALLCQKLLKLAGMTGIGGTELKLDGDAGDNTVYAINMYQTIRRTQGVELGTDGHNDGSCGKAMWQDLLPGIEVK